MSKKLHKTVTFLPRAISAPVLQDGTEATVNRRMHVGTTRVGLTGPVTVVGVILHQILLLQITTVCVIVVSMCHGSSVKTVVEQETIA